MKDTNKIIVLYPQAKRDSVPRIIWGGSLLPNPNACWDWNGWYGHDADQKTGEFRVRVIWRKRLTQEKGVQMMAIVNQVNRIIGA